MRKKIVRNKVKCPMCENTFIEKANRKTCSDRCKKRRLRILKVMNLHMTPAQKEFFNRPIGSDRLYLGGYK